MSKYKEVFNARKLENESSENLANGKSGNDEITKSGKMEIQKDGKNKVSGKMVNLGIKVEESRRRLWVGKAKLEGVTISEVIISALSKKFGEPD